MEEIFDWLKTGTKWLCLIAITTGFPVIVRWYYMEFKEKDDD